MARFFARVRLPLQYAGFVLMIAGLAAVLAGLFGAELGGWPIGILASGVLLVLIAAALTFLSPAAGGEPVEVGSSVAGRWTAVNSPSGKIPSHGTHAYGQTYAVDLVYAPEGIARPTFGSGRGFRPAADYPAFGQPIHAPADGVVVRRADGARDHLSRSSWLAYAYLMVESAVRELRGPTGVLGNHLVLRLDDGTHFVLAHLRRGSIRPVLGAQVRAGEVLAECGNSGNSTEPHLHCQRQDLASTFVACGLPWTVHGPGIPGEGESAEFAPERQ